MNTPEEQEVLESLEGLGQSSEEIAAELKLRGCTGIREEPEACPLWAFLSDRWPGSHFEVDPGRVVFWHDRNRHRNYEVDLPLILECFINEFDDGEWPELEATPGEHAASILATNIVGEGLGEELKEKLQRIMQKQDLLPSEAPGYDEAIRNLDTHLQLQKKRVESKS